MTREPDALLEVPDATPRHPPGRVLKFRQAAFVYLHVGLLYEFAVLAIWQVGLLPTERGSISVWLVLGAAIDPVLSVFSVLAFLGVKRGCSNGQNQQACHREP